MLRHHRQRLCAKRRWLRDGLCSRLYRNGVRSMAQPQPKLNFTRTSEVRPIVCPQCGEKADIMRRSPDTFKGDGSEVWSFQCNNDHTTKISGQG